MTALADDCFDEDFRIDLETLQLQQSWQSRYKTLMQWGGKIRLKADIKQDHYLITGCDTKAWLAHRRMGPEHQFSFYAESKIIRGLGVLLLSQLHNKTDDQIPALDLPQVFARLDLNRHLSPSRGNGLNALTKQALLLSQVGI